MQRPPVHSVVNELARVRLETPQPGDEMLSQDRAVRYRVEAHTGPDGTPTGKHTFHRATPKLSKAERKAAKRARHRG